MRSTFPLRRGSRRGQSAVEMALILPVLLVVLMGIIEFSRALFTRSVLSNAAREGARYGIIHPTWATNADNADPDNIAARTKRLTTGLTQANLSVVVEFPDGSGTVGNRLRVTVSYPFRLILPFPVSAIVLRSSSTMRIEQMGAEWQSGSKESQHEQASRS